MLVKLPYVRNTQKGPLPVGGVGGGSENLLQKLSLQKINKPVDPKFPGTDFGAKI